MIASPKFIKTFMGCFDEHMQEILRGASIAFILKILAGALVFAMNVILARLLGAERIGVYYLALTLITISATLGRLGMENTLIRFLAAKSAKSELHEILDIYRKGMFFTLCGSCFFTIALFTSASWLANSLFHTEQAMPTIKIFSIAVIPVAMFTLQAQALQGLKKIRDSIIVLNILPPLLTIPGILLMAPLYGIEGVVLSYTISAFITLAIGVSLWRNIGIKNNIKNVNNIDSHCTIKKLLQSSVPLFFANILNLTINWSSTVFIAFWLSNTTIGIFNVANRTAMLTSYIFIAVNSIVAPKFAELYIKRDVVNLEKAVKNAVRLTLVCALPVVVVFVIFPRTILSIFGSEFTDGFLVLRILVIGQLVYAVTNIANFLLSMTGNEKVMMLNVAIGAISHIIFSVILIPKYGINGAAYSSLIAAICFNIVSVWTVAKKVNIDILPFWPVREKRDSLL